MLYILSYQAGYLIGLYEIKKGDILFRCLPQNNFPVFAA
ncbi:hypothetical protein RV10_GL004981 [Enterococcus pallens]|nr:hypothetical protein RV10_GL004981 [Enterococcus pallens]